MGDHEAAGRVSTDRRKPKTDDCSCYRDVPMIKSSETVEAPPPGGVFLVEGGTQWS
jgi:hypothetical protein